MEKQNIHKQNQNNGNEKLKTQNCLEENLIPLKLKNIINQKKTTLIVFEFINSNFINNDLKKIILGNYEININITQKTIYQIIFNDSFKFYKIIPCIFVFQKFRKIFSITLYKGRMNYFYCEGNKINKYSIEIIFSDFIKGINNNLFIFYNKIKYLVKEDTNLKTRKRINFINIDLDYLSLVEDSSLNIKKVNYQNNSLQIVINQGKIIGIFDNIPYKDPIINKEKLLIDLETIIENSNKILDFQFSLNKEEFINKMEKVSEEEKINYKRKLNNFKLEKENYINFFIENPDDIDLKILDLISEYYLLTIGINIAWNTYIQQYYCSKKCIHHFLEQLNSCSPIIKIRLKLTAIITLYTLIENNYGRLIDRNIFFLINFNDVNSIYGNSKKNCQEFIDLLDEFSEIFPFFLQINSNKSLNYIESDKSQFSSKLSMLTLEEVKYHLYESLPNYGIRLNLLCNFFALTILETRLTIFSEIKLFDLFLSDEELTINNSNFDKRFRLSNLLKHENMCHIKISMNNYESFPSNNSSPHKYYNFNKEKYECLITYDKQNKVKIPESGYSFEYFLTKGNIQLIKVLKFPRGNFKDLYINSPSLMTKPNLLEFCNELQQKYNEMGDMKENYFEKNKIKFSFENKDDDHVHDDDDDDDDIYPDVSYLYNSKFFSKIKI